MKKPVRPFAARISFEDKTRLAVAQVLDKREELDLSWISRNILGRNHAYLFQYLFKGTPRTLDFADAVKLAHFLKIDPAVFSPETAGPSKLSEHFYQNVFKPAESEADTIALHGPAKSGDGAILMGDGETIGRAARHPAQKGMKDAFAVYAVGESMAPRYRSGELVYVVMNKPPVKGQDCVVELKTGEGYLREFDRRTGKDVICRQLAPPKEWKRPASDVKAIHAVVGRG